jgi:ribosomal protein L28
MARVCDLTGKKTVAGRSRRHQRGKAGGVSGAWSRKAQASKRTFRPNLVRNVKVLVGGKPTRLTLSTKALKRIKNFGSYKGVTLPSPSVVE